MVTIRRSTPLGEEAGQQSFGVEKRLHPASARRSGAGKFCDGGSGGADYDHDDDDPVGKIGSPAISHLSKGGRFSEHRERIICALLPEAGPGCRALVPYTASPAGSRRASRQQQQPSSRSPLPATPLLALPPSTASGASSHLEIPLEVFPIIFQAGAPTAKSFGCIRRDFYRKALPQLRRYRSNPDRIPPWMPTLFLVAEHASTWTHRPCAVFRAFQGSGGDRGMTTSTGEGCAALGSTLLRMRSRRRRIPSNSFTNFSTAHSRRCVEVQDAASASTRLLRLSLRTHPRSSW
ncbi:unnamed protein product [Scytosiphon promiscuus]